MVKLVARELGCQGRCGCSTSLWTTLSTSSAEHDQFDLARHLRAIGGARRARRGKVSALVFGGSFPGKHDVSQLSGCQKQFFHHEDSVPKDGVIVWSFITLRVKNGDRRAARFALSHLAEWPGERRASNAKQPRARLASLFRGVCDLRVARRVLSPPSPRLGSRVVGADGAWASLVPSRAWTMPEKKGVRGLMLSASLCSWW